MKIVELSASTAEQFIRRQPVSVILFYTPIDVGLHAILDQFTALAGTFNENVRFGICNVSAPENSSLIEDAVIVTTPTVIYYQFGNPLGEDVGLSQIQQGLNRESIIHFYCRTSSGLNLAQ